MIDKIYENNLLESEGEMKDLDFPELIRFCRNLLGIKQYVCAEYLGFEHPRYKKLELGLFSEPLREWEMDRLESFFKLDKDLLLIKQKQYLGRGPTNKMKVIKKYWRE